ncbi:MAG: heme A synthase [Deltaproteobacteria bacterium]|nr:MAG: heme A synthase [Deltaproteobacteria bacterium]
MTTSDQTISSNSSRRVIGFWLFFCCGMIYAMVVIGGVTRLTQSGLSMVEWKPILGVLPPMNQKDWTIAFNKYKKFPEYKVRKSMTMSEFKFIYYMEWFHRIWGRLLGLVFGLPLLFFWIRKKLDKSLSIKLFVGFILGGAQGLLGWYMVKSGLVNQPHVSHYRLTAHLLLAVFLYGYILWIGLDVWRRGQSTDALVQGGNSDSFLSLRRWSFGITGIIFVMIGSGGLVAGKKAGYAFNTWPTIAGAIIPDNLFAFSPWYKNFFENTLTIQFTHRSIAYLLCVLIPMLWWFAHKANLSGRLRVYLSLFVGALLLQVFLGITTLLYIVPVSLGAMHQAGALLLLTFSIVCAHSLHVMARTSQPSGE